MSKFIVHNTSKLPDHQALELVSRVVREGRISNEDNPDKASYCYISICKDLGVVIDARRNKTSDTLYVHDYREPEVLP